MKQNYSGFTLVEILASVTILTLVLVIAVPGIGLVSNYVKENTYENKKSYLVTKAENWASKTFRLATNVQQLIEAGEAEADNKSGDIINTVNHESMLCDVIRLEESDGAYKGVYTNEKICDYEDIAKNNSIINLVATHENGEKITDSTKFWSKGNVLLKVGFKSGYEDYKDYVTKITFEGNNQKTEFLVNGNFDSTNSITVSASQILNQEFSVFVTLLKDGKINVYLASSSVKIDKQRPIFYDEEIKVIKNDVWTNIPKIVSFVMSDESGSGIYGYSISTNPNCPVLSYTKTKKSLIKVPMNTGIYYLCAKDYAGNFSEDVSTKRVVVDKIDLIAPIIQDFNIRSNRTDYNNFDTILNISATDRSSMSMYLSNTDFQKNGSWETYENSKNWKVGSSLDGTTKTIYLSLKDEAGNIRNQKINYSIYSECANKSIKYTSGFNTCSKTCGGGIQSRNYIYVDNITQKQCGEKKKDTQNCNTFGCCSKTQFSYYGNYGACSASCGTGLKYRTVYYKSAYDGSSCGASSENTSCYLKSCTEYRYRNKANASITSQQELAVTKKKIKWKCLYGGTYSCHTMGLPEITPTTCKCRPKTVDGIKNTAFSFETTSYTCEKGVADTSNCFTIFDELVCYGDIYCNWDVYSCPSGMTLNGTMCYGNWSPWQSNPIAASPTIEIDTRNP